MGKFLYKGIKWMVRLFYPKTAVSGEENLPQEPVLVVGNHAQMNGPIVCELYFPRKRYTWCAGQMMHWKEVADYAYQDFWSQKPKRIRWFFRILSYIITPLSVCVFTNADTIGVYHDARILSTFKTTVKRLSEGASVVIFPEHGMKYNHIVNDFQDKFVDIAKLYHKKTGKELAFVPMYVAPALKKLIFGTPIRFNGENPIGQERSRICDYLKDEITRIAEEQPRHRVVPYQNVPKREYPFNIP